MPVQHAVEGSATESKHSAKTFLCIIVGIAFWMQSLLEFFGCFDGAFAQCLL
jgi:hypothetical protein